ncbi:MAG: Crp/Fnr family transcriptional regulator [Muribaculaceae bacterium]|nr:Crp/Fnr family transcriptional regulator [Muribaculaceae bacterium]
MYEILLGLPLFSGVSHERLSQVVGMTKFHFLKYLPGETIVNAGDPCTHIKFIISGEARFTVSNNDGRFLVSQTLSAPEVIAPECLFGTVTQYPCSGVAITPTGILQITKADYLKILNLDQIFLFNYLNVLSMNAQKATQGILAVTSGNLADRIAFWIVALTQRRGTDITLSCRQRDLYSLFGVQRTSLISTLESLRDRNILTFTQNEIRINSREALIEILHNARDI